MKKLVAVCSAVVLSLTAIYPSFAQMPFDYIVPTEMTISQVREQAGKNIRGKEHYQSKQEELQKLIKEYQQRYGKRYVMIDKEGNEVVKYFYNENVQYDPINAKKDLERMLDDIRDTNEKEAVQSFLELLRQENSVFLAKNQLESEKIYMIGMNRSYRLGKKTKVDLKKEEVSLKEKTLQWKKENELFQQKYENLNRMLGYPLSARYQLNKEGIVKRVGEGKGSIVVPFYLNAEELSKLKQLKDEKEELDKKKKALEKLKDSWESEDEKEKIREKINLLEREENYQNAEDTLSLQLKKTYLSNMQQFIDLSAKQQELEHNKKDYSNLELKKKLGKVSQADFLKLEGSYYMKERGYLDAVILMYQSIDEYEKLYDKK